MRSRITSPTLGGRVMDGNKSAISRKKMGLSALTILPGIDMLRRNKIIG